LSENGPIALCDGFRGLNPFTLGPDPAKSRPSANSRLTIRKNQNIIVSRRGSIAAGRLSGIAVDLKPIARDAT
jgi:hypothetical protein